MPAFFGAALAGGTSLLSDILGGQADSKAASQETAALDSALNFDKGVYSDAQSNLSPYLGTGKNAVYSLASLFGLPGAPGQPNTGNGAATAFANFTNTPAYQFPLQQGELAANRSLAAQGLTGSGAAGKALTQYGQGYASQGFNGYISQLASLAGLGQNSAVSLGNIGTNVGNTVAGLETGIGNAQAAGTLGSTNSLLNGITNGVGALTGSQPIGGNNSVLSQFIKSVSGSSYGGGSGADQATYNPSLGISGQPFSAVNPSTGLPLS